MNVTNKKIDGGKEFDWGRTSTEYAKFRDIYPREFFDKIVERQLCIRGQSVLDVGTGTGFKIQSFMERCRGNHASGCYS